MLKLQIVQKLLSWLTMPSNFFIKLINSFSSFFEKKSTSILLTIGCLGIVLRIVLFFQNRNLIIDEANVVRIVFEKSFAEIANPLSYKQYAPIVYLWVLKIFGLAFGFNEMPMRLLSLLAGVASIFIFYKIFKILLLQKHAWIPFAIFCGSLTYLIYSSTVKQYMCDVFISLLLVWLALTVYLSTSKLRFVIIWIAAGSISIWCSMTSVFVLAAIFCYYVFLIFEQKKSFAIIILPALFWGLQFFLYYYFVLQYQIQSDYLLNYFNGSYFLLYPFSVANYCNNGNLFKEILYSFGGHTVFTISVALLFIFAGIINLWKNNKALLLLLLIPFVCILVASAMHRYVIVTRVLLFQYPLLLILYAYGVKVIWELRFRLIKFLIVCMGFGIIGTCVKFSLVISKYEFYEPVFALEYLQKNNVTNKKIYVHHAIYDAVSYYTHIHTDKLKYTNISKNAITENWDFNYADTSYCKDTTYVLQCGGLFGDQQQQFDNAMHTNKIIIDTLMHGKCKLVKIIAK